MDLMRYLFVFVTGGSLGFLLGSVLASGGNRERSIELGRTHNIPKTPMEQRLRTATDG